MAKLVPNVTHTTSTAVLDIDPGSLEPGPHVIELVIEDTTGSKSAPATVVVQVRPG